jgi:hypothetical protein
MKSNPVKLLPLSFLLLVNQLSSLLAQTADSTNKIIVSPNVWVSRRDADLSKKEAVVPVRIRNTSTENLYAPLKIEIKKMTGWKLIQADGKEVETATIDFSSALNDWKYLPPNAVSEPVKLRFRFDGLANAPNFNFEATGLLK